MATQVLRVVSTHGGATLTMTLRSLGTLDAAATDVTMNPAEDGAGNPVPNVFEAVLVDEDLSGDYYAHFSYNGSDLPQWCWFVLKGEDETAWGQLDHPAAQHDLTDSAAAKAAVAVRDVDNTSPASGSLGDGVRTLTQRISASLFAGITSLAQWLGLLAGKQTGDATARAELRATGAGDGTYDETQHSLQAVRDRGDAAWTTASGFSTLTAEDVWTYATRTLTSGSGIVLAKGTGITGLNDLDASGIRAALGLASANLDSQLEYLDVPVSSRLAAADYTAPPTAEQCADALLDRSGAIAGKTPRQALMYIGAAVAGRSSGAGTSTETFLNFSGTAALTVSYDDDNNRTTVLYA